MKRSFVIVGITLLAIIIFTIIFIKARKSDEAVKIIKLKCANGYTMMLKYHEPDKNGVLSKLSLTVITDNEKNLYEMDTAMSASGAKFETQGDKYFLWEHQGTFMFGKGEENITDCREF